MQANLISQDVRTVAYFDGVTTGPITKYVATTGSDTTGDGTAALPYATPLRAYDDIPRRVAHKCNIEIAAGIYPSGSFPRQIDNIIVGDGSLTFYGKGAPTRKAVNGGPHTVTGIASTDITQIVTVAAAAWGANEFRGYWARVITGGHPGRTWPVQCNDGTTLRIPLDGTGDAVHNGDTIEIISPSVHVEIEDLHVLHDVRTVAAVVGNWPNALMVFANLHFDASGSASIGGQFVIQGNGSPPSGGNLDGPAFEFVRFDALADGIRVSDVLINYGYPVDAAYIADSDAGILNLGESNEGPGLCLTSAGGLTDVLVRQGGNGGLNNTAVTGRIHLQRFSNGWFDGSAASIDDYGADSCEVYATLVGVNATTPALSIGGGFWPQVLIDAVGACNYAIDISYGAHVLIHGECKCSATLCDKGAIRIGAMCKVRTDHALAGFLGKTAGQEAYIFAMDAAVKAATWPAAGTYVTDAKGGEFLRVA